MHKEKQTVLWHILIFKCFLCNYKVSKGPICMVVFFSCGFPTKLYKLHANYLEVTNIFLGVFFSTIIYILFGGNCHGFFLL